MTMETTQKTTDRSDGPSFGASAPGVFGGLKHTHNYSYLGFSNELRAFSVEKGLVTMEEILDANTEYTEWVNQIAKEWPPQRIGEFLLERERRSYQYFVTCRDAIELENKEARMRGVSFKQREKFVIQLGALDQLIERTAQSGKGISQQVAAGCTQGVHDIVVPDDVSYIVSVGFERFLQKLSTA